MTPAIVLGDKTTGGGVVIEGSPNSTVDGKPIARVGDKATCPINGHGGVVTIVSGTGTSTIDGKPTAIHMSSLSCGCKVIASQSLYFVDNTGGSAAESKKAAEAENTAKIASLNNPNHEFDQHFELVDEAGNPLENINVTVVHNGVKHALKSDAAGKTPIMSGQDGDELSLQIGKTK